MDSSPRSVISDLTLRAIHARIKRETIKSLALEFGINYQTLWSRLNRYRKWAETK